MKRQLYVKLQTPSIELTVEGIDGGGRKASVLVGFRRFEIAEASDKLEELEALRKEVQDQIEAGTKDKELDTSGLDKFLASNVLYFLNEELLTVDENGKQGKLKIKDSRLAPPEEDFWETPEECKEVILGMYLNSLAWRTGFSLKLQDALVNTQISDDQIKNL